MSKEEGDRLRRLRAIVNVHADRRTKRNRTKSEQRRRAIEEQKRDTARFVVSKMSTGVDDEARLYDMIGLMDSYGKVVS